MSGVHDKGMHHGKEETRPGTGRAYIHQTPRRWGTKRVLLYDMGSQVASYISFYQLFLLRVCEVFYIFLPSGDVFFASDDSAV